MRKLFVLQVTKARVKAWERGYAPILLLTIEGLTDISITNLYNVMCKHAYNVTRMYEAMLYIVDGVMGVK